MNGLTEQQRSEVYEAGLRDGKIQALEKMVSSHQERLDHHETRLRAAERILYGLIGALALIELIPAIKELIK